MYEIRPVYVIIFLNRRFEMKNDINSSIRG